MTEVSKVAILMIDSLRYDCVGHQKDKKFLEQENVLKDLNTSTIDSLSKDSVCFNNCYSTSSATIQVVASIFTGTTQVNHRILNNTLPYKVNLNKNVTTLAQIFKKLGYLTVYSGDTPKWFRSHEVVRGFDFDLSYNDHQLIKFLNEHKDEKIFLFHLFSDVHYPYLYSMVPPYSGYNDDFFKIMSEKFQQYKLPIPKKNEDLQYWSHLYKVDNSRKLWLPLYVKGVTKFDKGRFKFFMSGLKDAGFLEKNKSLIAITADHGQGKFEFNDSENFNHNGDAYEESARVPLIVRLPSLTHEIKNELVSNIDLFKIILDVCTGDKTEDFVNYKLYSINPLKQEREFAWFCLYRTFPEVGISGVQELLYARTIIAKNKKYTLRGRPEYFLNPKSFETDDKEFFKRLYNDLFIRFANDKELKFYLKKLGKDASRIKTFNYFLNTHEYKSKNKYFVYDLEEDPKEENPLDPFFSPSLEKEFLYYFKKMIDLDKPDVKYQEATTTLTEEEKKEELEIKKELEKLGYL